jgi:hypothetical protein
MCFRRFCSFFFNFFETTTGKENRHLHSEREKKSLHTQKVEREKGETNKQEKMKNCKQKKKKRS